MCYIVRLSVNKLENETMIEIFPVISGRGQCLHAGSHSPNNVSFVFF